MHFGLANVVWTQLDAHKQVLCVSDGRCALKTARHKTSWSELTERMFPPQNSLHAAEFVMSTVVLLLALKTNLKKSLVQGLKSSCSCKQKQPAMKQWHCQKYETNVNEPTQRSDTDEILLASPDVSCKNAVGCDSYCCSALQPVHLNIAGELYAPMLNALSHCDLQEGC